MCFLEVIGTADSGLGILVVLLDSAILVSIFFKLKKMSGTLICSTIKAVPERCRVPRHYICCYLCSSLFPCWSMSSIHRTRSLPSFSYNVIALVIVGGFNYLKRIKPCNLAVIPIILIQVKINIDLSDTTDSFESCLTSTIITNKFRNLPLNLCGHRRK